MISPLHTRARGYRDRPNHVPHLGASGAAGTRVALIWEQVDESGRALGLVGALETSLT